MDERAPKQLELKERNSSVESKHGGSRGQNGEGADAVVRRMERKGTTRVILQKLSKNALVSSVSRERNDESKENERKESYKQAVAMVERAKLQMKQQ